MSVFGVAAIAGIQQAERIYPGYGNDAPGFGKRFGAALGDTLTNDFLSHAVFRTLLHEDPRYHYQGSGTKKQRLFHAVSYAFVTRSDSGHRTPNLFYILGDTGSGALSNLYYPHADRDVGLVFAQAAVGVAGQAAGAVVREFLSRHLTTNVPGEGKPSLNGRILGVKNLSQNDDETRSEIRELPAGTTLAQAASLTKQ